MRDAIKSMMECLAGLAVWPSWIVFKMSSRLFGRDRACEAIAPRAARWTGVYGEYRRRMLYRRIIKKMGEGVVISFGSLLSKTSIELGNHVYIGAYSLLGDVIVGDDTLIADQVCIPSGPYQHGLSRLDIPVSQQPGLPKTICIGEDSWIGSGAIVMADIGNHCVVGAGSVVTKPVEDYKIVAGNPARIIGDRREKVQP